MVLLGIFIAVFHPSPELENYVELFISKQKDFQNMRRVLHYRGVHQKHATVQSVSVKELEALWQDPTEAAVIELVERHMNEKQQWASPIEEKSYYIINCNTKQKKKKRIQEAETNLAFDSTKYGFAYFDFLVLEFPVFLFFQDRANAIALNVEQSLKRKISTEENVPESRVRAKSGEDR